MNLMVIKVGQVAANGSRPAADQSDERFEMSVGTADIMEALLPASNGPIARAMQELEGKLSAWASAVANVNDTFAAKEAQLAVLLEEATRPVDVTREAVHRAPPPAPETPARVESAPTQANQERPAEKSTTVAIGVSAPVESSSKSPAPDAMESAAVVEPVTAKAPETALEPETPEVIEALLAELNPETAEAVRARYEFFKGRKSIRELIQEFEDEADDEESLLMSLDDEIAKAVRVKFRLYNGRKTLREVIAEVEAQQAKAPPAAEKKSWWGKRR